MYIPFYIYRMTKTKVRKPKETEYETVGEGSSIRRQMLLINARKGIGKVSEKDGNVILRLGTESYGYIVYTILNATLNE